MLPHHLLSFVFVACAHAHLQHQSRSSPDVLLSTENPKPLVLSIPKRKTDIQRSSDQDITRADAENIDFSNQIQSTTLPRGQRVPRSAADKLLGKVESLTNISPPEFMKNGVIAYKDLLKSGKKESQGLQLGETTKVLRGSETTEPKFIAGQNSMNVVENIASQAETSLLNDVNDIHEQEARTSVASDTSKMSKRSLESPTENTELSELLRHTFMSQNPMMPSGYFDDGSALQSNLPLPATRVSDTDRSSSPHAVAKRKPESATVEHNPAHTAGDDDDDHDDNNNNNNNYDNDNTDDAPISVESRSSRCNMPDLVMGNDLPWTCQQRFSWRYLGEHIYPSRLSEVACEGSRCWHGHYNCTPILYTLNVLEFCLNGCFDQRVPSPLRSRWRWLDLNVTVGCQCVR